MSSYNLDSLIDNHNTFFHQFLMTFGDMETMGMVYIIYEIVVLGCVGLWNSMVGFLIIVNANFATENFYGYSHV